MGVTVNVWLTVVPLGLHEELVVLTADGKGVVMRREALLEATRRAAEAEEHKMDKRLSKGEKKNRKRMATVAGVYTILPNPRTPEDILSDLAPVRLVESEQERPRPQDKRVWASLIKTQEMVLREAFEEAHRRDPHRLKTWVALSDGNKKQLELFQALAQEYRVQLTIILDIIHVLEYLWKATTVFNKEGTPAAEQWVNERFLEVLRGRGSQVAGGIRRSATKRGLTKTQRKAADKCASYLLKYGSFMHYSEYLDRGFPIATGVIEGACRYLIKDRMDVIEVDSGVDYRRRTLEQDHVYHSPLGDATDDRLAATFARLATSKPSAEKHITILGRDVAVRWQADGVIWFDFAALCETPRSQNDYLELAQSYHTLILSNVPLLATKDSNVIRRLTLLVDVLYDHRVKLIISAAAPLVEIAAVDDDVKDSDTRRVLSEFSRTASRLTEMQSAEYMSEPHLPSLIR